MQFGSSRGIVLVFIVLVTMGLLLSCTDEDKKEENYSVDKPVIYLYPEEEQEVSVKLQLEGELMCTYPEYNGGWEVIAKPDGTLINLEDNMKYSYLFWEANIKNQGWNLSEGFVVKGEDTKDFLQQKLSEIGLIPREYNEFIVYWLPYMQGNEYNLIHFAQEEYTELAKFEVNPEPDSVLRVFMVFKALDEPLEVKEQAFPEFEREGFTVVEWGGSEVK